MKKYQISYHIDNVKHIKIIEAKSRREALQIAWSLTDADDVYVSEATE